MASTANVEHWEHLTGGKIFLPHTDSRGNELVKKTGGKVGATLRITTEDRELYEERVFNREHNVFRNGKLRPKNAVANEKAAAGQTEEEAKRAPTERPDMTDAELRLFFTENKKGAAFPAALEKLKDHEVVVRRLLALAETEEDLATASQLNRLKDFVEENYSVSKSQDDDKAIRLSEVV